MSSQINPNNIDGTYPVAGVDNNTQGFRNNFTGTQNNFIIAAREINDLMNKVVLTASLTYGNSAVTNTLNGAPLNGAVFSGCSLAIVSHGILSTGGSTETFDFNSGSFHSITLSSGTPNSPTIVLPANPAPSSTPYGYSEILINVTVTNIAHQLSFTSLNNLSAYLIPGYNSSSQILSFAETGSYLFKLGTADGTNWILSSIPTQIAVNRTPANSIGNIGDTSGMIAYDNNYLYICTANYVGGNTAIWSRTSITLGGW